MLRFKQLNGNQYTEWDYVQLNEIAHFSKDKVSTSNLSASQYVSTENLLQNFQGIVDSEVLPPLEKLVKFEVGDTLLSNIRPYLKKTWKSDRSGGCNADVLVIQAEGAVSPDYLYVALANDTFINYVMTGAKGVKMPRGDKQHIMDYVLPIPCLEEQQKIADCLSGVDAVISDYENQVENMKNQKKGVMQKLFSQEVRFKADDGKAFSAWEYDYLGNHCSIKTGKLDANAMDVDGKYPFFTCSHETYRINQYSFDGEAIIIAGNGDLGHTKYYAGKFDAYQRTYVLMNFCDIPLYIKNAIDYFLPLRIREETYGSAMPYIKLNTLTELEIPIPCNEEQLKIADCLTVFDTVIEDLEKTVEHWKNIKKGLLQQLFDWEGIYS